MESIAVCKSEMAVLPRQGMLASAPFSALAFAQEILERAKSVTGLYHPLSLVYMQEEEAQLPQQKPAYEIHLTLNLPAKKDKIEPKKEKDEPQKIETMTEKMVSQIIRERLRMERLRPATVPKIENQYHISIRKALERQQIFLEGSLSRGQNLTVGIQPAKTLPDTRELLFSRVLHKNQAAGLTASSRAPLSRQAFAPKQESPELATAQAGESIRRGARDSLERGAEAQRQGKLTGEAQQRTPHPAGLSADESASAKSAHLLSPSQAREAQAPARVPLAHPANTGELRMQGGEDSVEISHTARQLAHPPVAEAAAPNSRPAPQASRGSAAHQGQQAHPEVRPPSGVSKPPEMKQGWQSGEASINGAAPDIQAGPSNSVQDPSQAGGISLGADRALQEASFQGSNGENDAAPWTDASLMAAAPLGQGVLSPAQPPSLIHDGIPAGEEAGREARLSKASLTAEPLQKGSLPETAGTAVDAHIHMAARPAERQETASSAPQSAWTSMQAAERAGTDLGGPPAQVPDRIYIQAEGAESHPIGQAPGLIYNQPGEGQPIPEGGSANAAEAHLSRKSKQPAQPLVNRPIPAEHVSPSPQPTAGAGAAAKPELQHPIGAEQRTGLEAAAKSPGAEASSHPHQLQASKAPAEPAQEEGLGAFVAQEGGQYPPSLPLAHAQEISAAQSQPAGEGERQQDSPEDILWGSGHPMSQEPAPQTPLKHIEPGKPAPQPSVSAPQGRKPAHTAAAPGKEAARGAEQNRSFSSTDQNRPVGQAEGTSGDSHIQSQPAEESKGPFAAFVSQEAARQTPMEELAFAPLAPGQDQVSSALQAGQAAGRRLGNDAAKAARSGEQNGSLLQQKSEGRKAGTLGEETSLPAFARGAQPAMGVAHNIALTHPMQTVSRASLPIVSGKKVPERFGSGEIRNKKLPTWLPRIQTLQHRQPAQAPSQDSLPQASRQGEALPQWAQDFLRDSTMAHAEPPAPAEQRARQSGNRTAGQHPTGKAPANAYPPTRAVAGQQEAQMGWAAPGYAGPAARMTHKKKEEKQEPPPLRFSDAEINRMANKVYGIIQERMRRDQRRLGN